MSKATLVPRSVEEWISLAECGRRLGYSSYATILKTLACGGVRKRQLPGRRVEYSAADLDRLIAASIENASTTTTATA